MHRLVLVPDNFIRKYLTYCIFLPKYLYIRVVLIKCIGLWTLERSLPYLIQLFITSLMVNFDDPLYVCSNLINVLKTLPFDGVYLTNCLVECASLVSISNKVSCPDHYYVMVSFPFARSRAVFCFPGHIHRDRCCLRGKVCSRDSFRLAVV